MGAALTSKPRHAVFDHVARQELPKLTLHELRQARPVAGLRHRAQEGLQVLGDETAAPATAQGRIRVTSVTDPTVMDVSDAVFAIQ